MTSGPTASSARFPLVGLAWGFAALCAATYGLLILGSLVRAHGAGLACPDWPLCFGALVPRFDLRIAFEWSHRALAGGVSLGLLALTVAAVRLRAPLARPLAVAWVLLGAQVVLGGLTVLLRLAPWTVTAHLLVGTSFCAVLLWICRDLFQLASPRGRVPLDATARVAVAVAAVLLLAQIALGGWVSSHAAGLACASFPTCDGTSFAPAFDGPVGLHVLHRLNGYALGVAFAILFALTRRSGVLGRMAGAGALLVLAQIAVGVANVLLRLPVEVTGLHSALAAALFLLTAMMVREALLAPASVTQPGTRMAEARG